MVLIESPKRERKPIDFLSADEDRALLSFRGKPHEEFILWLFLDTGIRTGEARRIRICDIDLQEPGRETLRVRYSKSQAGQRTIPLSPEFVVKLRDWFAHLQALGLFQLDGPILPTRHGTHAHATWIWRVLKRTAAHAIRWFARRCKVLAALLGTRQQLPAHGNRGKPFPDQRAHPKPMRLLRRNRPEQAFFCNPQTDSNRRPPP
jgi:integrase